MDLDGKYSSSSSSSSSSWWTEGSATDYQVRGPGYMKNHLKQTSAPSIMKLIKVDLLTSKSLIRHYAQDRAFLENDEFSFFFIVVFQMEPLHIILTFGLPSSGETPLSHNRLFNQFMTGNDDQFRKSRFKVIPRVVKGSWMIDKMIGRTPVLFANKINCDWHLGKNYLEVDCLINSNRTTDAMVKIIMNQISNLTIEVGFVIQGQVNKKNHENQEEEEEEDDEDDEDDESELPEQMLGVVRFINARVGSARSFG